MRLACYAAVVAASLFPIVYLHADDPTPDALKARVDERAAAWWPTPEEKKFDRIGWAADIRTARKLAAEQQRPVFLFTMDGRVNTGRC